METQQEQVADPAPQSRLSTETRFSKYFSMVLFIALPFIGFLVGITQESSNPAQEQNETKVVQKEIVPQIVSGSSISKEKTVYRDAEYGFSFEIPKVWNDVGFTLVSDNGTNSAQKILRFSLLGKNSLEKDDTSSYIVGIISLHPIAGYVPKVCGSDEMLCSPGEEIGRNNKYVFVSENFSPEAYGVCYDTDTHLFSGSFYNLNKDLCEKGSMTRYSEREKGSFTTFDINQD